MRNFRLRLERALAALAEDAVPTQYAGAQAGQQADQQRAAQDTTKQGSATAADGQTPAAQPADAAAQKAKQQAAQDRTQLTQIQKFDRDIGALQARIDTGQAKPDELKKLSTLLKARDAQQKRYLQQRGIPTT